MAYTIQENSRNSRFGPCLDTSERLQQLICRNRVALCIEYQRDRDRTMTDRYGVIASVNEISQLKWWVRVETALSATFES